MEMFYSGSTGGFYSKEIHGDSIPKDAVSITHDEWQCLLNSQGDGKLIQLGSNGKPESADYPALTNKQIFENYIKNASQNLEKVAAEWGYDSFLSAISYINSKNTQFKSEAKALIAWRDKYWDAAYTIDPEALPKTAQAFIDMLPPAPSKPTI